MRILIGPMSSPAGKLGIERLLAAPPGTDHRNVVELIDDWPEVLAAITRCASAPAGRYDVLIAEFRLPGSPAFAEVNDAGPGISVIDVDLELGTSNTPMFDVGSERLRRLAEWLTREAGLTSTAVGLAALESLGPEGADDAGPAGPAPSHPEPPPALDPPPRLRPVPPPPAARRADADTQLADLIHWLELRFALTLARAETEVPRQDFPGWAMSSGRARALLDSDLAGLPDSELRRRERLAEARLDAHVEAAAQGPSDGSLGRLCHAFGLDSSARRILLLTAAPDIAGNLARAIGFQNDNLGQCRPTLSLLAEMLAEEGWRIRRRLAGDDSFGGLRLVAIARPDPLIPDSLAPLIVAPDVVAMLLGAAPGAAVEGATLFDSTAFGVARFDRQVAPVLRAARAADKEERLVPIVHFQAHAPEAEWLAGQLASVGEPVLLGDVAPLAEADFAQLHERLLAFGRAARTAGAVLLVSGADAHDPPRRAALVQALARDIAPHVKLLALQGLRIDPTGLRTAPGGVLEISRPRASREERVSIWSRAAAARGLVLPDAHAIDLAATFAFDRAQAEATIALAQGSDAVEQSEAPEEALREAARIVSRASAPASVRRIETGLRWDDLIVPAAIKAELRSIATQVRHGAKVWEKWGFGARIPYGQATIALLAGPSGTGKTMAAQIIAGELGAALFQVDLAKTVSKYIGETEKIVDELFRAARDCSAVLLFDEADALFGRRSEIHDAHDRYANIQVDQMLQRVEEHDGVVLLTTNRKGNLDPAFLRRLKKVIDFPMPDESHRARIWERMLPPEAPRAAGLDPSAFTQLPLSGGAIVNSVITAAFLAAEQGEIIQMHHLVAGARAELAKSGMESAGRGLTHLIDGARAAGTGGAP